MTKIYTDSERQRLIDLGLWDFWSNTACVGAEAQLTSVDAIATEIDVGLEADDINRELAERKQFSEEELRVLWRISHEDYVVFARMVERFHGILG